MIAVSVEDINQYMNANPHLIQVIVNQRATVEGAYGFFQSFISTNCDVPRGKAPRPMSVEEAIEDLNELGYPECWTVETYSNWFIAGGACIKIKDGLLEASQRLSRWTYRIVEVTHHDELLGDVNAPTHIVFGFMNEREATFAKMFD